ncbi:hypothetical protein C8Q76DRAFT_186695 [Earliella scabrosa]|nr:hypothetical protein C8Q76DRAFT_186695 [Earliella scabrosa]
MFSSRLNHTSGIGNQAGLRCSNHQCQLYRSLIAPHFAAWFPCPLHQKPSPLARAVAASRDPGAVSRMSAVPDIECVNPIPIPQMFPLLPPSHRARRLLLPCPWPSERMTNTSLSFLHPCLFHHGRRIALSSMLSTRVAIARPFLLSQASTHLFERVYSSGRQSCREGMSPLRSQAALSHPESYRAARTRALDAGVHVRLPEQGKRLLFSHASFWGIWHGSDRVR